MLKIPRFFRDEMHRSQVIAKLKLARCPACNRDDTLIRNGLLRGNNVSDYKNKRILRAQRVLCSKRRKTGQGCGASLAIFNKPCLSRFTIDAVLLTTFLKACLKFDSIHAAWQGVAASLSLSSAYRIWHRLQLEQSNLRQRLCRLCRRPEAHTADEPRHMLIEHLLNAFDKEPMPVAAYQAYFQAPFFS